MEQPTEQPTEQTVLVSFEDCKAWAKASPNSKMGFLQAYERARELKKQGKSFHILWKSRNPLEVVDLSGTSNKPEEGKKFELLVLPKS